jgi:hypothetical protein
MINNMILYIQLVQNRLYVMYSYFLQMLHLLGFLVFGVILLKTDRSTCICGKPLKKKSRGANDGTSVSLYTRDGILEAKHLEFRCSGASRPASEQCKNGYYYGYYTSDRELYYNEDALSRNYLLTSRKTGFSIGLLWEWTLSFLFEQCTFESMAKKYTAFHLGGYEDEELEAEKENKVDLSFVCTVCKLTFF